MPKGLRRRITGKGEQPPGKVYDRRGYAERAAKENSLQMIETADIVKYGMIAAGIFIIISSFWFHSIRKLTVNLAVVWEILGVILIATGMIPILSSWTYRISTGTGLALFFVGAACLWGGFQFSLLVSRLAMENQELAMQISLLVQENEKMMWQLEELEDLQDRMKEYEELEDKIREYEKNIPWLKIGTCGVVEKNNNG